MIPIPRSFMLTAHRWTVKYVRSINEGETFGDCDSMTHTIRIAETVQGRPTTQTERVQTFVHEFYHALLQTVGRDDESLVLTLENLTYQALTTAKFKRHEVRPTAQDQPDGSTATRRRDQRGAADVRGEPQGQASA